MKIKRTEHANRPRAFVQTQDHWGYYPAGNYADTVIEQEYPTHSMVLGPDGKPLQYEDRPPLGFDLRPRR